MSKYQITIEFSLSTTIDADGISFTAPDEAEDFSDNSYFSTQDIECDGGEISFVIEAEDEDAAEYSANEVVYDGMEVEDYNGFTWLVNNVNLQIEKVEEPMTFERAVEILTSLADSQDDEDAREALDFLLAHIKGLTEKADQAQAASLAAQDAARVAQDAARACQEGVNALTATVTDTVTEA
jgi:hypothetical protein